MRRKLLLIPAFVILLFSLAPNGSGADPPSALIAQKNLYYYNTTCTEFTINLTVLETYDTQMWEANITFDPTILEVVSASEGEFLKSGYFTFFDYTAPPDEGWVYIAATYYFILGPGNGVNGSGILGNVTFHVKDHSSPTPLHFNADLTRLWYNNGTDLKMQPCIRYDSFFTITGDIDCDGDVDWVDFGDFASAYGSKGPPQKSPADVNYNYRADFDLDGDVDWVDFGDFASNYGKSVGP